MSSSRTSILAVLLLPLFGVHSGVRAQDSEPAYHVKATPLEAWKPRSSYSYVKDETNVAIPDYAFRVELHQETLHELMYAAHYNFPGKEAGHPAQCTLVLTRVDRYDGTLKWRDVRDVYFRYGDTKVKFQTFNYLHDVRDSPTTGQDQRESLSFNLAVTDLTSMSESGTVAIEAGEEVGVIEGENIKPLRWFLQSMTGSIPSTAEPTGRNKNLPPTEDSGSETDSWSDPVKFSHLVADIQSMVDLLTTKHLLVFQEMITKRLSTKNKPSKKSEATGPVTAQ